MSSKCIFVIIKECQQLVLQVKEAEVREGAVRRDAMAKKVGDLEMANQVRRGGGEGGGGGEESEEEGGEV